MRAFFLSNQLKRNILSLVLVFSLCSQVFGAFRQEPFPGVIDNVTVDVHNQTPPSFHISIEGYLNNSCSVINDFKKSVDQLNRVIYIHLEVERINDIICTDTPIDFKQVVDVAAQTLPSGIYKVLVHDKMAATLYSNKKKNHTHY